MRPGGPWPVRDPWKASPVSAVPAGHRLEACVSARIGNEPLASLHIGMRDEPPKGNVDAAKQRPSSSDILNSGKETTAPLEDVARLGP